MTKRDSTTITQQVPGGTLTTTQSDSGSSSPSAGQSPAFNHLIQRRLDVIIQLGQGSFGESVADKVTISQDASITCARR